VLIYNHNKELVGIDDETLQQLGYPTLSAFLQEHKDVAELFVKKPGYIHNFQNFPWIDFVLHAEAEDTRAIIENERKHFSCNISITPIYLSDAPEKEGYIVYFKHLKNLGGEFQPFETQPAAYEPPVLTETEGESVSEYEEASVPFEVPELPPIELPEINPDGSLAEAGFTPPPSAPRKSEKPMLGDYINKEEQAFLDNLQTDRGYVFDPHVAADELGLPVDLIEEFIGDFIQQAHEFKNGLFDAALKEDFDEVHILSHKLKGVAANLRIEDAFEVLSIVNTSRDQVEIEANLKHFYRIVAKMEGKPLPETAETPAEAPETIAAVQPEEEDIYNLDAILNAVYEPPVPTPEAHMPEEPLSLKDETEPIVPEPRPEADETLEPFGRDIIPGAEQHLIEDAEEEMHYKQVSGDETKDAQLAADADYEALHYDPNTAAAEIGLDVAFVRSLVNDFVQDAQSRKAEMLQAIAEGNLQKARSIAFEFKGLADNLRVEGVSRSLTKLIRHEQPAAAKREAEHFYALLKQL